MEFSEFVNIGGGICWKRHSVPSSGGDAIASPETSAAPRTDLTPYVPRVVIDWLRAEPGARWRELEGTLAFVDLSGFTAMSERLAKLGKAGAEEVSEVMNATFARLLDVAYAGGGGLLKFGGDALLLFFDGDDHAARAAGSAYGMRSALNQIGRLRTSAGTVVLRMHVGLHSGPFHFFLVGSSHRELLIAGPGVSETVAMEEGAEAGEILLSAGAATAVPAGLLGEEKAGGRLLQADAGGTSEGVYPLPPVEGLDLAACVPVAIRDYVGLGPVEPEHRQATVAFVRFQGTDAVLADAGPQVTSEALEELIVTVQTAADEHGVCFLETDVDRDGGRVILVAGAPQTAGDDEERLLRTVRAVADAAPRLAVQVGVNRGRVFAGEVGAPFRRTYAILGETAALAARLMSKAEPGQILVMPDVLERSPTRFETVELEPFRVKGKAEPVVAHEVRAVAGVRESARGRQLPFVGRERELAIIGASLVPVRMGFGSLVELIAEPGMGKSRLLEELKTQSGDMAVVSAACEHYEQSTPYFAFRALLRSLIESAHDGDAAAQLKQSVEALAPELVPWIPLLAIPLDVRVEPTREVDELQPAFRRARLHGVVEELLAKLLPGPTLIAFEDVHWMDEASCDLLRHLGGQVTKRPWLICTTRRTFGGGFQAADGVPPLPAMTIMLEPLADEAAAALAGAGGRALLPHEVDAITERAGGNPLFIQELLASGRSEDEEALPESVESVVATRIDKLEPSDRGLLRYAAVMGATFSGTLIGEVLADDAAASADSEAWDRLAEFVERDPYTPGAFRFRHVLFRDAAYEGLSYRRRRELHARVGEAYERRYADQTADNAELLSLHFFHAQVWDKAYRYSRLAGERAQEKFANVEAAAFYRRTLEVAPRLRELDRATVGGIWEALGDVSELAGLYGDAANAYRSARKLAEKDGHLEPMLLLKEGLIRERSARYSEALRWYNRGLQAAARIGDELKRRQVTLELGLAYAGVRLRQGHFKDCVDWCRKVLDGADFAEDLSAIAHAYYLQHLAFTSIGSREKEAFRGLALPIYEEVDDLLGQANVLNNLGIDAYYDGRWDEALDLYGRSQELRVRIGDVVGAATITNNIGEVKSDQGHLDAADDLFHESLEVFERSGYRYMLNLATSNLGRAAARAGRCDDGRSLLLTALAGFHEIKAGSFVLETKARLAECAVLAGDSAAALEQADETLRAVRETGAGPGLRAMIHRVRGYAFGQRGDLDAAEEAVEESVRIARDGDAIYELAQSLEARSRLRAGRGTDGTGDEREASELFGRLGVVSQPDVPLFTRA
jgi:class 3 adenylate cyclase/tetratricopeptide (TPR) repeat protein